MEKNDCMKGRVVYYDFLRVIASFCVVMTHVAQQVWYHDPIDTYEWNVANVYESAVRWSVPVFVMISGSLFLSSCKSFKLIIKNNIGKHIKLLMVWGGGIFCRRNDFGKRA